ncbi:MAG TPA: sigma-70 family RNA polymerase sigma factor [Nitrospirota bacterium]|nr:sigma-70 family RNA polymerase sigma factor [Nitrospirota bacterium]
MSNETNPLAGLSYNKGGSGTAPADDDAGLVARSRQGDLDAFEELVLKHQKRMLNIAYRLIGDYDEACEVVQDAFVSAHRNVRTFRGDSKFTTWLTAITVNLSKNRLKQLKSRQGHEAYSLDDPVETSDGEMTIDPPSKAPSVLDRLEKRDVQSRVQGCIKALDPDFREVLVLRDLQDLSYEEIGNLLNLQGGTVKSRLFRAREMVKDCLKRVMGEL